ncbi:MAG: hypothetical protein LBS03_01185 [Bacteroidales bacterium]|nr:hypothetical protein [Bacteroidales bacterium]
MNENLKDQNFLLVREKDSNELRITKMGKDGKALPIMSLCASAKVSLSI